MKRLMLMLVLLGCCASALAQQRCQGLIGAKEATASSAVQAIYKAIYEALVETKVACGSINVIVDRVTNRKRSGGRRLEAERAFDEGKARANLEAAMQDPSVKARIDEGRKDITDESVRLAYEAAVFDEEGFYGARDLRVQQLQQKLN